MGVISNYEEMKHDLISQYKITLESKNSCEVKNLKNVFPLKIIKRLSHSMSDYI